MSKLFIIGNGFDLSHNIPSSYTKFKEFLMKKCAGNIAFEPLTYFDKDGDTVADEKNSAGLLINLIEETTIGDNWSDLESYLAKFDYSSIFEDYDISEAINDDDDDEMFRMAYLREDLSSELRCCVKTIKSFFKEWINEINLEVLAQKRYKSLFEENDLFLTFNYTKTLEKIYSINESSVCHIHGTVNQDIYFGHGDCDNPYESDKFSLIGIDIALSELFNELRKDTEECYQNHRGFFDKILDYNITDIYSIGFSFSKVDLFYLQKLCTLLKTNRIIWHLTEYDELNEKNEKFKRLIKQNGFKGLFGELVPE